VREVERVDVDARDGDSVLWLYPLTMDGSTHIAVDQALEQDAIHDQWVLARNVNMCHVVKTA